jgi:hypothetical protein
MKKSSLLVITIPLLIVGALIAGVFVLRTMNSEIKSIQQSNTMTAPEQIPSLSTTGAAKPVSGFGKLQPTQGPVSDLRTQYDASSDDGGVKNLNDLEQQAASL